jgi:TniQ protein
MFVAKEKKLAWEGRSIVKGESMLSIFRKIAFRNRVSIAELLSFIGSEGESIRYSDIKFPAHSDYFRMLTGCPEDLLVLAHTRYFLGEIPPQQMVRYRCSRFRYCPSCLLGGYHSELFQLSFISHCPFHDDKLIERCRGCGNLVPIEHLDGEDDCCSCGCTLVRRSLSSSHWREKDEGPECLLKISEWLHVNVARTRLALHTVFTKDRIRHFTFEPENKVQNPIVAQFDLFALWGAVLGTGPPSGLRRRSANWETAIYSVAVKSGTRLPHELTATYCKTRSHLEALNIRHDLLAGNVRLMQLEPRGPWRINPFIMWRTFWERTNHYFYAENIPEELECILDRQLGELFDIVFWRGPTFTPDEIQRMFCHVLVKNYAILCHRAVEDNLGSALMHKNILSPIVIHNNRLFSFRWPQMPLNACRLGGRRDAVAKQVLEGFDIQAFGLRH